MDIAIASGKGGTGKTTVALNLAFAAKKAGMAVQLLDCDVEEPNCNVFLQGKAEAVETVEVEIPQIDRHACNQCGICSEICEFNALACLGKGKDVIVFPELCHSCSACWISCPQNAIRPVKRAIGQVRKSWVEGIQFAEGILDVSQVQAVPVIEQVLENAAKEYLSIIDCPPGTSCPMISAVREADFVLLVTEPTPFGLNDLKLAIGVVKLLKKRFAVVINRSDMGNSDCVDYLQGHNIKVLAEIKEDRSVAESYSKGEVSSVVNDKHAEVFSDLLRALCRMEDGQ